jgi:hypothetical protein
LTLPSRVFLFGCAAVFAAAQCFPALAEPVVRVKAKLTAFDGQVMTLEPVAEPAPPAPKGQSSAPAPAPGEPFKVAVTPDARYVGSSTGSLADLKPGGYAGAAVSVQPDGSLRAQDVFLYAPALRGTGEGRFSESQRLIVNGAVRSVTPAASKGKGASFTLHYRGASLGNNGPGKTLCEGRAVPLAFTSALSCEADAVVDVPAGTPVTALTIGDKSLMVVGRMVTVAMTRAADNKPVSPGVVVQISPLAEKPQAPPPTPPRPSR